MAKPAAVDQAAALRRARWTWAMLSAACLLAMVIVLPLADDTGLSAHAWVLVPVFWLALAVPATIGVYGHCFRAEWSDDHKHRTTGAADYVRGLTSIWGVLATGVGLSLVACLLSGAASPGIWPGALMLMLLVLSRPKT